MVQAQRIAVNKKADINLLTKQDIENTLKQIQQQQPKENKIKIGFAI